ncbi:Uma2 family endonuclease [Planktothrix agardhii]|jgi:Uma2 family endonuclease|uniref:Uma2 family endonuclease n=1 Tax=Planktothrix agardhii TaxID=1160 RepID=UPI003783748C
MVSQPATLNPTEIIYPETDGKPMANNTEQFNWIVAIEQNLEWLFANDPNVFVAGDLFWYPVEGKPHIVNAPDVLVVLGRPKGKRGSYMQWKEEGIAPQVVFEILSPGNTKSEMERKLVFYERYGVEEYYIYNPENYQFQGWQRGDGGLDVIEISENYVSPRLGIRFEVSEHPLQIYHPDGAKFLSYVEINQQLEQEIQWAETERQRAETEHQRAEETEILLRQETERSQRLAERLRQMGINPDELD